MATLLYPARMAATNNMAVARARFAALMVRDRIAE
jgi:hypothetical protein